VCRLHTAADELGANGTRGDRRRMRTDTHRLSPIGQIGLDPGMYTASDTEAITEAFK